MDDAVGIGVRSAASLFHSHLELAREGRDAGKFHASARVTGQHAEGTAHVSSSRSRIAKAQLQLRKLDVRPGSGLGLPRRRVESESHRVDRSFTVSDELARIRDARVRGEARSQCDHPLKRGEGVVIMAELDKGVADDAVRTRRAGQKLLCATAVPQRRAKVVLDERERAEPENRIGVVDAVPNGPPQRCPGAR